MKKLIDQCRSIPVISIFIGMSFMTGIGTCSAADQQLRFPTRSNGPEAQRLFEEAIRRESVGSADNKGSSQFDISQHPAGREQLVSPKPINGNSGKYMSPYTSDKVLAEWTDKMISVKLGKSVGSVAGSTIGTIGGQEVLKHVPLVGGILGGMIGKKAGESVGKTMSLQAGGGWETIKKTSDISFNSLDDLAVYLYVNNSDHEHFQLALEALTIVYPEFAEHYRRAVKNASIKP